VTHGVPSLDSRWQLYRLLSDPFRLRLLALAAEEELSVGELAELLDESQPNVSRHASPLRQAGLLADRRQGTRTMVRLADDAQSDAVVADALGAGRRLCQDEGRLVRVAEVVRARDASTREFFARPGKASEPPGLAPELPGYLCALAPLLEHRELALDAGAGDGGLLDVLAPVFKRVVALDRSEAQLGRSLYRVRARGYKNVELICGEVDGEEVRRAVGDGADVVMAARMLHHAPLPRATVAALAKLVRPGGTLVIIDYGRHEDERLRDHQADVWMGFDAGELASYAEAAGLTQVRTAPIPAGYVLGGDDAHLLWQMLVAERPAQGAPGKRGQGERRTSNGASHKSNGRGGKSQSRASNHSTSKEGIPST
jgi:ArsR family transcriptional regulator